MSRESTVKPATPAEAPPAAAPPERFLERMNNIAQVMYSAVRPIERLRQNHAAAVKLLDEALAFYDAEGRRLLAGAEPVADRWGTSPIEGLWENTLLRKALGDSPRWAELARRGATDEQLYRMLKTAGWPNWENNDEPGVHVLADEACDNKTNRSGPRPDRTYFAIATSRLDSGFPDDKPVRIVEWRGHTLLDKIRDLLGIVDPTQAAKKKPAAPAHQAARLKKRRAADTRDPAALAATRQRAAAAPEEYNPRKMAAQKGLRRLNIVPPAKAAERARKKREQRAAAKATPKPPAAAKPEPNPWKFGQECRTRSGQIVVISYPGDAFPVIPVEKVKAKDEAGVEAWYQTSNLTIVTPAARADAAAKKADTLPAPKARVAVTPGEAGVEEFTSHDLDRLYSFSEMTRGKCKGVVQTGEGMTFIVTGKAESDGGRAGFSLHPCTPRDEYMKGTTVSWEQKRKTSPKGRPVSLEGVLVVDPIGQEWVLCDTVVDVRYPPPSAVAAAAERAGAA